MKILMLGWELPPHNSGGLGVACYQLCKAMSAKEDVDIEFVVPYQARHDVGFMTVTSAHPQSLETFRSSFGAYESWGYGLGSGPGERPDIRDQQQLYEHAVAGMVAERAVDIVHAHDWLTFRAALRVKELKGCPMILHVHSVESDRAAGPNGNPLVKEIEGLALQMADHVIAVSQHTKDKIVADYGIPEDRIEVVHNSIEPGDLEPLDPQNSYRYLVLMKSLGYKVVVNVGRLTIQKGLPNLLRAAKEVIAREPKTLFLIVGDGEQYRELVTLAAELGIGANVLFADFQRGKRWRDAFGIGDLFVMPSISEPFGLTALEAVGYGTPVLISHQSGVSEVLMNCLKADYWDVHEMSNQILGVLRNAAMGDELSRNATQEYQRLSWGQVGEQVLDLYKTKLEGAAA